MTRPGPWPRPLSEEDVEIIREVLDEASPDRDSPTFAPLSRRYASDPAALRLAPRRDLDGAERLRLVTP